MSALYTSLTQMKMAMNGGVLPPMTPLTAKAMEVVKPEFTIGMGALREDAERGLQCPVCGRWYHKLSQHANASHQAIGGSVGIAKALGIPHTSTLISGALRTKLSSLVSQRPSFKNSANIKHLRTGAILRKRARSIQSTTRSVGHRNMQDRCEAQLKNKFIDIHNELGRAPSATEFVSRYEDGANVLAHLVKHYGSWNSAKAHFGFEVYTKGFGGKLKTNVSKKLRGVVLDTPVLLDTLKAWYETHGKLPRANQVGRSASLPVLFSPKVYLRQFKARNWRHAMEIAASMLRIYGGEYGIPEHLKPRESAA